MVRDSMSIVFMAASQLSNLWQNFRRFTCNQKTCERDFLDFCRRQNAINAIWRLTLRRMLTQSLELKFVCENVAFVLDNKYT